MIDYSNLAAAAKQARFITYATVNQDGSPHSSPMFCILGDKLDRIYMGTHPESLHCRNIIRTGQAFATMFERLDTGSVGLYLKIENFHMAEGDELNEALTVHNKARAKFGKDNLPIKYYQTPSPQRMLVGDIAEISTNDAIRNSDGRLTKDTRTVIDPSKIVELTS